MTYINGDIYTGDFANGPPIRNGIGTYTKITKKKSRNHGGIYKGMCIML
jgi:hypothetical protein